MDWTMQVSMSGKGRKFCLPENGHTAHEAHPAFYSTAPELSPSSPSSEGANEEWRCASTTRYEDNFTFGFIHLAINL